MTSPAFSGIRPGPEPFPAEMPATAISAPSSHRNPLSPAIPAIPAILSALHCLPVESKFLPSSEQGINVNTITYNKPKRPTMKKTINIIFTCTLTFAFLSCGTNTSTKDDAAAKPKKEKDTNFHLVLLINEVDGDDGGPNGKDFIELYNRGTSAFTLEAGKWKINQENDVSSAENINSTTVAAGGYLLLENGGKPGFSFGIGRDEGVFLFYDGVLVDSLEWSGADRPASWQRIPDGRGWKKADRKPTPGTQNK